MKRLPLFTLLFTTFALSILLPKLAFCLETPPLFEKTSLTRDFASQTYLYVFDFDFVNHLSQPIEILSVSVSDMNGNKVEQDWEASGPNWDPRLMTHALSGDHPLVKIISKPRGTPLEKATVSPVGDRIEIKVTNRILSAGEAIKPSLYLLSSKNKYDSLVLRVAYRINGNLQEVSRAFTVAIREEEAQAGPTPPDKTSIIREAPYDFQDEKSGLVNCNQSTVVPLAGDDSKSTTLSDPNTGEVYNSIRVRSIWPDNATSATGQAGVGIIYVAPKDGTLTINAHVNIKDGSDYAQLLRISGYPTALLTLKSDVQLHVYRFAPRRDDDKKTSFRKPIILGDGYKVSLIDIIKGLLKIKILPTDPEQEGSKYTSQVHPGSLQLSVSAGDTLYVCAGIWSQATSIGIIPGNYVTANYDGKVQDISINYTANEAKQ